MLHWRTQHLQRCATLPVCGGTWGVGGKSQTFDEVVVSSESLELRVMWGVGITSGKPQVCFNLP